MTHRYHFPFLLPLTLSISVTERELYLGIRGRTFIATDR